MSLLIAILLAPATMDARKKKDKKYNKKTVPTYTLTLPAATRCTATMAATPSTAPSN